MFDYNDAVILSVAKDHLQNEEILRYAQDDSIVLNRLSKSAAKLVKPREEVLMYEKYGVDIYVKACWVAN